VVLPVDCHSAAQVFFIRAVARTWVIANSKLPRRTTSHFIPSSDEAELQLRVRSKGNSGAPVLFVHGAGLASSSFDIPNASWMDSCVAAGKTAYALDVRGYGQSHSKVMQSASVPYARATDAIKDIDDAIGWISQRHKGVKPALVGVSWGSVTTGLYASGIGVEKVSCLNLIAPIFAERNQNWINLLADPTNQSALNPNFGAFRRTTAAGVRERWDEEIPDGSDWRDADTFKSLMASIMADDSESGNFDPPQFRAEPLLICGTALPVRAYTIRPILVPRFY